MPTMTRPPGSGTEYKDGVTGYPGTKQAPGGPPGVQQGTASMAQGGYSFTQYCPGFFPNMYWARPERAYWPGAGMPIAVYSDNLMPVPATDPRGIPAPLAVPLKLRGKRQIGQPATLVVWPDATSAGIYE